MHASHAKRFLLVPAALEGQEAQCTFAPAINPASEQLLDASATVPASFDERQRYYNRRKAQKLRQLQSQLVSARTGLR